MKEPESIEDLCGYIVQYAGSIFVRENVDGKWDAYSLAELPATIALKHALGWVRDGRIPVRVLSDEEVEANARARETP